MPPFAHGSLMAALLLAPMAVDCWWMQCPAALSDGPSDADVEVRIGNLPPSTQSKSVYVHWWAARRSNVAYNPFENPSAAQSYSSCRDAYASFGDPEFNGGKVRVSETGQAAIRVRAPASYSSYWHGNSRYPHVHFAICGNHGRPKKFSFKPAGVKIKGGCRSNTESYTVISALELGLQDVTQDAVSSGTTPASDAKDASEDAVSSGSTPSANVKDWDALEFSDVYQCVVDAMFYNQLSSTCMKQCPVDTEVAHGQCVRREILATSLSLASSWRLHIDCNEKCWADSMPLLHHSVRLALADHLDITFQEVEHVRLRKDPTTRRLADGSQATHAHLSIRVSTKRLADDSLLGSFIPNPTIAAELFGLTVHSVEAHDTFDGTFENGQVVEDNLPGESSDLYSEYYPSPEKPAERGPIDDVPWSLRLAIAAVVVMVLGLPTMLFCRRRLLARGTSSDSKIAEMDSHAVVAGVTVGFDTEFDAGSGTAEAAA